MFNADYCNQCIISNVFNLMIFFKPNCEHVVFLMVGVIVSVGRTDKTTVARLL